MVEQLSPENATEAGRHIRGATIAWGAGSYLDLADPDTVTVELEDYAYCLAYTVRWRGQARTADKRRPFYGVGQHCVIGAEEMLAAGIGKAHALAFLFHESDEIPFGDVPGPAKRIPEIAAMMKIAGRIGTSINDRFCVDCPDPDLVKRWDIRMLVTEKLDLLSSSFADDKWHNGGSGGVSTEGFEPFERRIVPYAHPEEAALEFLKLCHQLGLTNEFGDMAA